jgi:gliding motility-associated protein GldL
MSKRGGLNELFFSTIMPKVYGIGAAVVIVGAMFKLLHYPGAEIMLGVGLSTEAIIFFLSAFEPKKAEPDWTKVYPELAEDYQVLLEQEFQRSASRVCFQKIGYYAGKCKSRP